MSDINFGSFRQPLEEITKVQTEPQKILNNLQIRMLFFRAAQVGETGQVLTFLTQDPDLIKERDLEGNTAFLVAVEANQLETVQWLMKFDRGLKNQCNKNGDSALMLAIKKRYTLMICFLLQQKPDLNTINNQGKNAYELAQSLRESGISILIKTLEIQLSEKKIKRKTPSKTLMKDLRQESPMSHNALLFAAATRSRYVPPLTSNTDLKTESEEKNPPESLNYSYKK